jgi:CoA:oxalate CoA-transferase
MLDRLKEGMKVDELNDIEELHGWVETRSVKEVVNILVEVNVPVAPINQISEVSEDPQVKARETIIQVDHPAAGRLRMPGFPVKYNNYKGRENSAAPVIGQHTHEVLSEVLGYSNEELGRLIEDGVIK